MVKINSGQTPVSGYTMLIKKSDMIKYAHVSNLLLIGKYQ